MNNLSGPVELIKKSFEIFFKKENFVYFLKIQSPLLAAGFVGFVWTLILSTTAENLNEVLSTNPVFVFSMVILGIISAIIGFVVGIASIDAVRRAVDGSTLSIKETFILAKEKIWSMLLMRVIAGIIMAFGFLLLIIPGIIVSVWFTFSAFEVVLKGAGATESLSKSKALVKGKFWPIFGRLFVFGIFGLICGLVLSILPYRLGVLATQILGVLFILPVYLLYLELGDQGQSQEQV